MYCSTYSCSLWISCGPAAVARPNGCSILNAAHIAVTIMYVRVKRLKTTIFICTEPQETGLEVKSKLQKLLDGKVRSALCPCSAGLSQPVQPIGFMKALHDHHCRCLTLKVPEQDPEDMKLILVKNGVELDDAKLLSDLHVQNDDEIGLCFKVQSTGATSSRGLTGCRASHIGDTARTSLLDWPANLSAGVCSLQRWRSGFRTFFLVDCIFAYAVPSSEDQTRMVFCSFAQ